MLKIHEIRLCNPWSLLTAFYFIFISSQFQEEGLWWMTQQEKESGHHGGILAGLLSSFAHFVNFELIDDVTCHSIFDVIEDEMGMGKVKRSFLLLFFLPSFDLFIFHANQTIQTISMIAADIESRKKGASSSSSKAYCAPTLIVVPTSALFQWQDEIQRSVGANQTCEKEKKSARCYGCFYKIVPTIP